MSLRILMIGCWLLAIPLVSFGQDHAYVPLDSPMFMVPDDVDYDADRRFTPKEFHDLRLSLARPKKPKGKCPGVICIHGGAWSAGKRESLSIIIELAQRGYVATTIDYRLSPKHPFPAQLEDIRLAVRWMRANAGALGVDPDRIGVIGYSAGAHLAAMLATVPVDPKLPPGPFAKFSSEVQAVACYYGIYDMCTFHKWNMAQSKEPNLDFKKRWSAQVACLTLKGLLGGDPQTCLPAYRAASPIEHISKLVPPMFLTHGTADALTPHTQAEQFVTRLQKEGVKGVELQILKGAEHSYGSGVGGEHSLKADAAMLQFLNKILKP